MKNKIILDLQLSSCINLNTIPKKSKFIEWIKCIFCALQKKTKLTIRITSEEESQLLNMYFRKKNFPTDVLSFPFVAPLWINTPLIGDLIICQKIIEHEAKINKISIETQMAHTVIHGTLHLLGYKHITDKEYANMKNAEDTIMKKLGYI